MKSIKLITSIAMATAVLVSCQKNTGKGENYLSVENDTYNIEWTEQEFQVGVDTDREIVNVTVSYLTEDTEWLTAQWVYLNDCININVSKNTSLEARSAEIKLSAKGVTPVTFIVSQDPAPEEQDPFDDGTEPAFEWDDSWDVYNFTYTNQGNFYKYEPVSYGELGVPRMDWGMVYGSSGKVSVGLKLEKEFLSEFGGQQIAEMAITATDFAEKVDFALVRMSKSPDRADMPSWLKGNCYTTSEVIWEYQNVPINDGGWAILSERGLIDSGEDPDMFSGAIIPSDGDVFLMAYLEGDGSLVPVGDGYYNSMLWIYPQPQNKFTPTYINSWNNEGKEVYQCKAGTCSLNFFFTKPE